jgi:phosphohistidine phosphatase
MERWLILLRHGHATDHSDDYARQLSEAGRKGARRAGAELADAGIVPDRILSSAAPRALETAQLVALCCGYSGSIQAERSLYLASETQCLGLLRRMPAGLRTLLVVGHNPTLSGLARQLGRHGTDLAPAAHADLQLELESWSEL